MATLERPQYQSEPQSISTSTLADGVPSLPNFPASLTRSTSAPANQQPDLIDLATEHFDYNTIVQSNSQVLTPQVVSSLAAAKQAFLFALSGLLSSTKPSHPNASSSNTPPGSSLDPWANATVMRRHSVPSFTQLDPYAALTDATYASSTSDSPSSKEVLPTFLRNLRAISDSFSPQLASPRSGNETLAEELQRLVDHLASAALSPQEARLARSLASLLGCIDRLLTLAGPVRPRKPSVPSSPSSPPGQRNSIAASSNILQQQQSPSLYDTLRVQTLNLQHVSSSRESGLPTSPFNNTSTTTDRPPTLSPDQELLQAEVAVLWGRIDDLLTGVADLCRPPSQQFDDCSFTTDHDLSPHNNHITNNHPRALSILSEASSDLPAYQDAQHPPDYVLNAVDDDPIAAAAATAKSAAKSVSGGTTARNSLQSLRRMSSALGPLDEKMQRDLESVSMAIERLYLTSPQLANQRVEPDRKKLREMQLAHLEGAIERLSRGRLEDQRAKGPVLKDKGKEPLRNSMPPPESLHHLIDQIDKAASRTLDNQRFTVVDTHSALLAGAQKTAREAGITSRDLDSRERVIRETILTKTGQGRLTGQDAVFTTAPSPRQTANGVMTMSDFLKEPPEPSSSSPQQNRARSNSVPQKTNTLKKKFSIGMFRRDEGNSSSQLQPNSPSRVASIKGANGSSGVRKSTDASQSQAQNSRSSTGTKIEYIVEEQRNLGKVSILCWNGGIARPADITLLSVERMSVLIGYPSQNPTLSVRIQLPCPVSLDDGPKINPSSDHLEIVLATADGRDGNTRKGIDPLDFVTPLTADELSSSRPAQYLCHNKECQAKLVDSSSITRYVALPSEFWAEMLDVWMCHQDQEVNSELLARASTFRPSATEALVGLSHVDFDPGCIQNVLGPNGPTHQASCGVCGMRVGNFIQNNEGPGCLRLLKSAITPGDAVRPMLNYTFENHVLAQMLEVARVHANYRFVIADDTGGESYLLIWLFNPSVNATLSSPSFAQRNGGNVQRTCKVFYRILEGPSSDRARAQAEFESTGQSERLTLPLEDCRRLQRVLAASTLSYPLSRRIFGELESGFLVRI